jgi:hypothetical protein
MVLWYFVKSGKGHAKLQNLFFSSKYEKMKRGRFHKVAKIQQDAAVI